MNFYVLTGTIMR